MSEEHRGIAESTIPITTHLSFCHDCLNRMQDFVTLNSKDEPSNLTKMYFFPKTFKTVAIFQEKLSNTSTTSPGNQLSETFTGGGQGLIAFLETLSKVILSITFEWPSYLTV